MNDCTLPRVLDADRRGIGCGAIFVGENHKATTILIQSQTKTAGRKHESRLGDSFSAGSLQFMRPVIRANGDALILVSWWWFQLFLTSHTDSGESPQRTGLG